MHYEQTVRLGAAAVVYRCTMSKPSGWDECKEASVVVYRYTIIKHSGPRARPCRARGA